MAEGWSRAQRALHWWVAALVLLGFGLGWVMVALPFSLLLGKFLAYQLHKTLGLTVAALVLWRLALRWRRGRPPPDPGMPAWQRRAAAAGHAALYALLLLVPLLGLLTADTAAFQVPTLFLFVLPVPALLGPDPAQFALLRTLHWIAASLLVALAAGHALAALRHHVQGSPVLRRMWRAPP